MSDLVYIADWRSDLRGASVFSGTDESSVTTTKRAHAGNSDAVIAMATGLSGKISAMVYISALPLILWLWEQSLYRL